MVIMKKLTIILLFLFSCSEFQPQEKAVKMSKDFATNSISTKSMAIETRVVHVPGIVEPQQVREFMDAVKVAWFQQNSASGIYIDAETIVTFNIVKFNGILLENRENTKVNLIEQKNIPQ